MTAPPRNPFFTDPVLLPGFLMMLLNALWGEPLWNLVALRIAPTPGVAELLHGTSGLLLLAVLPWRALSLKNRSATRVP